MYNAVVIVREAHNMMLLTQVVYDVIKTTPEIPTLFEIQDTYIKGSTYIKVGDVLGLRLRYNPIYNRLEIVTSFNVLHGGNQ